MKLTAAILLFLLTPTVFAVTIAPFDVPLGVSITEMNDYEQNQKARQDKDNQGIRRKENIYLRQLTRVAESKRLTEFDEWILFYLVDDETIDGGSRGFQQYQPAKNKGLKVRFYLDVTEVVIRAIDGSAIDLDDEQRTTVEDIARRETLTHKLIRQTTGRDWFIGETQHYVAEQAQKVFGAKDVKLSLANSSTRWEKRVAEFSLDVTFKNGLECQTVYLVLIKHGRPLNVDTQCRFSKSENGVDLFYDELGSRAFSYSDLPISRLSPSPILAQQPKGRVLDTVFSDATGELAFLTQDYESDTNWLTFWDLDQRKIVRSQKQAGDSLLLSGDQKTLFAMGNNRIHQAWLKVNDKYQSFGYAADMNLADGKQILDETLFALYPITLTADGELEVWNLGYNRVLDKIPITVHKAEKISITAEGQLLTANREGEFAVHQLTITSFCDEPIDQAYCDAIDVKFSEAKQLQTIPIGLDKGLRSVQLRSPGDAIVYCSEFPSTCGYIDLEAGKHQQFAYARNAVFNPQGEVVLDSATFDEQSLTETPFDTFSFASFFPGMAVSKARNLTFSIQPRIDHLTDHEIVVRDQKTGTSIDTIKRTVYPVRSLVLFDEASFGYFSTSYGFTQLNVVDTSRLTVEQTTYPMDIAQAQINGDWMVLSGADFLMANHIGGERAPITLKPVSDFTLSGEYLFFARDKSVYQYHLLSGDQKRLYSFDSQAHELLLLDAEKKHFVVRLNHGVFALPHLDKTLELPFQGGFTQALMAAVDRSSFFVSGLIGYSAAYNPSIEVIQQFDLNGEPMQEMEPQWGMSQVMFATNDGYLWSGDKSGQLTIRDIQSGLILETLSAHQGGIVDIQMLNNEIILTASTDGSVKLWHPRRPNGKFNHNRLGVAHSVFVAPDIAKRQLRLKSSLIVDAVGGHVMSSPDGYYWASPKALHDASFVNGDEIFDYARYDFWLNRPDIISARLGSSQPKSQQQWRTMVQFRQGRHPQRPKQLPANQTDYEFDLQGPAAISQQDRVELEWSVLENAHKLHVLVNQVPIYGRAGLDIEGQTEGKLGLDLVPGTNRIKAFVSGEGDVPSETRYLTYEGNPETRPDLYVLAVGVSDYSLDRLDLDYAAKDAIDITHALAQSGKFGNIHTKRVLDSEATRSGILAARGFLEQANSIDTVIVFFAGHGLLDLSDNYFFGTTDIDPDAPAINGLAYHEMSDLLDALPARQKLMLMDTCYSGEVTESAALVALPEGVSSRGLSFASESEVNVSLTMLQKTFVDLRSSTGAIVISAAGGREYAIETQGAKNGIFTASFIKGLASSDGNADGAVTVSELRTFTYDEVDRLSQGAQRPTTRKHNLDVDFAIF